MGHSGINITDMPELKYLGITEHVEMGPATIGEFYTRTYGKLGQYVGMNGIEMAGMPFGIYTDYGPTGGKITACFPVTQPVDGEGEIEYGELKPGKALHALHLGSYDGLHATWTDLEAYGKNNEISLDNYGVEIYMDDPGNVPEADVRTALYWPFSEQ